jgi:hypothetical protein
VKGAFEAYARLGFTGSRSRAWSISMWRERCCGVGSKGVHWVGHDVVSIIRLKAYSLFLETAAFNYLVKTLDHQVCHSVY